MHPTHTQTKYRQPLWIAKEVVIAVDRSFSIAKPRHGPSSTVDADADAMHRKPESFEVFRIGHGEPPCLARGIVVHDSFLRERAGGRFRKIRGPADTKKIAELLFSDGFKFHFSQHCHKCFGVSQELEPTRSGCAWLQLSGIFPHVWRCPIINLVHFSREKNQVWNQSSQLKVQFLAIQVISERS